jgi:hypothetical protein
MPGLIFRTARPTSTYRLVLGDGLGAVRQPGTSYVWGRLNVATGPLCIAWLDPADVNNDVALPVTGTIVEVVQDQDRAPMIYRVLVDSLL